MNVNYYLRSKLPLNLPTEESLLGTGFTENLIHLGGSSHPRFHARGYPGLIDTRDQWETLVRTGTVVAEHGLEYTPEEFLEMVALSLCPTYQVLDSQYVDAGLVFSPYEFC